MIATIALAVLVATSAAGAPDPATGTALPEQWQHWRYFSAVGSSVNTAQPRPNGRTGLVQVTLPLNVFARAQSTDLPDLRIIDEAGHEVPYAIDVERGSQAGTWRAVPTSEYGFVPGSYTQIVADKERTDELTDTLRVDSSQTNYFTYVQISASDDRKQWRIIRDRAPIYSFERDNLRGSQNVSFPATRARWLRVRVLDQTKAFDINAVEVVYNQVKPAELEAWPVAFAANARADAGQTWLEADAGGVVPGSAVDVSAPSGTYHRPVQVSASDDGSTWTVVGDGAIARGASQATNRVAFDEASGRYWRIAIFDHNDPPIAGLQAELLASPRHVSFRLEPAHTYWLLYGDSRATAPTYDVADVTTAVQRAAAPLVGLGVEQTNVGYVSPEPWTEQHPAILWIALGIVLVVMGGLAIRTLRGTNT